MSTHQNKACLDCSSRVGARGRASQQTCPCALSCDSCPGDKASGSQGSPQCEEVNLGRENGERPKRLILSELDVVGDRSLDGGQDGLVGAVRCKSGGDDASHRSYSCVPAVVLHNLWKRTNLGVRNWDNHVNLLADQRVRQARKKKQRASPGPSHRFTGGPLTINMRRWAAPFCVFAACRITCVGAWPSVMGCYYVRTGIKDAGNEVLRVSCAVSNLFTGINISLTATSQHVALDRTYISKDSGAIVPIDAGQFVVKNSWLPLQMSVSCNLAYGSETLRHNETIVFAPTEAAARYVSFESRSVALYDESWRYLQTSRPVFVSCSSAAGTPFEAILTAGATFLEDTSKGCSAFVVYDDNATVVSEIIKDGVAVPLGRAASDATMRRRAATGVWLIVLLNIFIEFTSSNPATV